MQPQMTHTRAPAATLIGDHTFAVNGFAPSLKRQQGSLRKVA